MEFLPLTAERWEDFAKLFGKRGACGGCWCMAWRRERAEFERGKGSGNRSAMRRLVAAGRVPGILAYEGGDAVGWCAVAPRSEYSYLARSRVLKPIDEQPVWSVSCLFVAKPFRRGGVSVALLRAAADFAISRGAKIVEGYPQDPRGTMPDPFVWTGTRSAFLRAGFVEAARGSPARAIMRRFGAWPDRGPGSRV